MDVLLDANMLVAPFQTSVSLFAELDRLVPGAEVATLRRTYNEARDLADGEFRQQVERLVEAEDIKIVEVEMEGPVDDVLFALAGEYIVATNDTELRHRLDEANRPYLYLRQGSHLEASDGRMV